MENHNNNVMSKLAFEIASKTVELADAQATIEELKQQVAELQSANEEA
ncbi:hypothetical protein [Weissella paramesenteroides]